MNVTTPVRPKSAEQIIRQCTRQKVPYFAGKLVIAVGTPGCGHAFYMPHSGRFYGTTSRGFAFSSNIGRNDQHRWMKQLRAFFHEEIKQ